MDGYDGPPSEAQALLECVSLRRKAVPDSLPIVDSLYCSLDTAL